MHVFSSIIALSSIVIHVSSSFFSIGQYFLHSWLQSFGLHFSLWIIASFVMLVRESWGF